MANIFVKQNYSEGVVRGVISSLFSVRRKVVRATGAGALMLVAATSSYSARIPEVQGPMFAQVASSRPTDARPAAAPTPELDQLVYSDGDRVRGRFLRREGDTLVFQSERFGRLLVPADSAEVILAKTPTGAAAAVVQHDDNADVAVERWPFSPLGMAAALKDFFGSWHGRFAVAAEMMQDGSEHNSGSVDAHLERKWEKDEVQLNGRYDYALLDQLNSTDMVKGSGVWRHDLPNKLFSVYRPTLEWNRAYYRGGQPADYVLLQQEVGAGINLINTDTRKLRAGLSENLFDTWVTPTGLHTSQNVESIFGELEAKLPWRIVLTNRGVWYYSFNDQTEGWENRFELNKKLTETLTMGVRHEIRHNNPDVRSADYERLRMLFGFDF